METVSIGGRKYSDPDILSLARQTGELIDPRFTIRAQARRLLARLSSYPGVPSDPFERIKILASLNGIKIKPMGVEADESEKRDAVLYPSGSGWLVLYNPSRPPGRLLFTIAHEVIHTLFPNSSSGVRFRTITTPNSREANELERLCDLGAAELVMPLDAFQARASGHYTMHNLAQLADFFGTSLEATAYRLASANPGTAVAGLLRHRRKIGEERRFRRNDNQRALFPELGDAAAATAQKKYRRQSLHLSDACGDEYVIRWNKSFESSSVVYQVTGRSVLTAFEQLPNPSGKTGRIEAMVAPFQQDGADSEFPDVLFFWQETV